MKHCLVVDDSRVIRTVARRIFEELQFAIGEAEDGMGALRACREKMPDLIFLDWNLPTMTGLDFIKSVRGQQDGEQPVILFAPPRMTRARSRMLGGGRQRLHLEAVRSGNLARQARRNRRLGAGLFVPGVVARAHVLCARSARRS